MKTRILAASLLATAVLLAACAGPDATRPDAGAPFGLPEPLPPPGLGDPAVQVAPVDAFMANLAAYCGQAFEGRVRVDTPAQPNDAFSGKKLVMHVRGCDADQLRIPFHGHHRAVILCW